MNAYVTDFTISKSTIYYGDTVTYSLVQDFMHPIASITWSFRDKGSAGTTGVVFATNTLSVNSTEALIGEFTVRVYVTYNGFSGSPTPHAATLIEHDINVLPPDDLIIVSGIDTNTALGSSRDVVFRLTGGGQLLTGSAYVYSPQEMFLSFESKTDANGHKLIAALNTWAPATQPDANFYPQGPSVIDKKLTGPSSVWNATNDGDWMVRYDQAVRVQLPHGKNATMEWHDFDTWTFDIIRVNSGTWKVLD